MNFALVKVLVLDVDGVLTDGRIVPMLEGRSTPMEFAPSGFQTQDGCAIKLWQRHVGPVALLTGRSSKWVEVRAQALGIDRLRMGAQDKTLGFKDLLSDSNCKPEEAVYMGDDVPDLGPMRMCGLPVAVANAVPQVKRAALYITERGGGCGAVAEAVDWILRKQGRSPRTLQREHAHDTTSR